MPVSLSDTWTSGIGLAADDVTRKPLVESNLEVDPTPESRSLPPDDRMLTGLETIRAGRAQSRPGGTPGRCPHRLNGVRGDDEA